MTELWETMFAARRAMWGEGPARSAILARDHLVAQGAREILIPGVGYGRNARPFLESGMSVTGIEISATAIEVARSELRLDFPIHLGSVEDMPFDDREYDGVFSYALAHLLDAAARAKFFADCSRQLRPGGSMIFTLISKSAPMYGQGPKLGEDWYERAPGMPMFFYDRASVARELGAYGIADVAEVDEPVPGGSFPFYNVTCVKRRGPPGPEPESYR
jgi:SAM-dependent methyltransferase